MLEPLTDIAVLAAFALPILAVIGLGAAAVFRATPPWPVPGSRPKPAHRRRLATIGGLLSILVLVNLASAIQTAYGAPTGERSSIAFEVLSVEACERPPTGFGLVEQCRANGYSYDSPDLISYEDLPADSPVSDALEPGDRVARYTSVHWSERMPLHSGTQWRSIDGETRPDLSWLPTAVLVAGLLAIGAIHLALRRRSAPT
ncbi:hypothetical protein [Glycomyces xiaoerkulensis]|uniref:hypothetical protein n=1 Tax=Glycomyces xiaoerkulensis TaxID=2038139 RepID=UPI000C258A5E|nr:hypothetical protein [Glycomyces xiaoerkulensis]